MSSNQKTRPLRILLVEDNEHDFLAFSRAFQKSGVICEVDRYVRAEDALRCLKKAPASFDIVVGDYKLPGMSGLELFVEFSRLRLAVPMMILTGSGSERLAAEALKAGVDDYMIKDPAKGYLDLLPVVIPEVVRKYGERAARLRAEEALRISETEKSFILNSSRDLIVYHDLDMKIIWANEIAGISVNMTAENLKGRYCWEIWHQRSEPCVDCPVILARETGKPEIAEIRSPDGREWLIRAYPVRNNGGRLVGLAEFCLDITERKKMEETLRKSHEELELRVIERTSDLKIAHDRFRNLAAHLQTIREEERTKIARDLHDELGQELTAMKMDLSWFRDKYGDHKPISDKTESMLDRLDATILSVKRICTELRPSLLDDFGLVAAMEWQANEFRERTGIECTVIEEPWDIELDKERSTALYRIFQEALTNVLKHAKATKVIASLTLNDDTVTLEVRDNGIGIKAAHLAKPQSFGLIGMRERVYPWGAKVEVTGIEGDGTSVKVTMPLSRTKTDGQTAEIDTDGTPQHLNFRTNNH